MHPAGTRYSSVSGEIACPFCGSLLGFDVKVQPGAVNPVGELRVKVGEPEFTEAAREHMAACWPDGPHGGGEPVAATGWAGL